MIHLNFVIEIWKSNVFEFDLAELYLIPKCVFEFNPAEYISRISNSDQTDFTMFFSLHNLTNSKLTILYKGEFRGAC